MSLSKTILVAHRSSDVRQRIAAALTDARHDAVITDAAAGVAAAVADAARPVSLILLDLGLAADGVSFVSDVRRKAGRPVPVVVFAGSVPSGRDIPALQMAGVAGYLNEYAATAQILPALAPHLFPHSFDRRSSPRVSLGVPVSYRSGQTIAGALTSNIGKGGIGIRTMTPLASGAPVRIKFKLPTGTSEIEADGRVAWANRQVGMGIQFERVAREVQDAIDAFVDRNA